MRTTVLVVGVLLLYARSEESVLSSRPCFKTMYVCMNTTTLFQEIGGFVDTIMQSPCGPGAYPGAYLWQRKKREKERKFNSKNKANNCSGKHYLLEYLVIFCKEPADKKKKQKIGEENWRSYY